MSEPMHSVDRHMHAKWDARVKELYRMPKARLVQMVEARHTFVLNGPSEINWPKDDLVADILRDEFPERYR